MRRGDLVTVTMPGAYGKPRPAVIVQSESFDDLDSVTFLPLTSDVLAVRTFRILVAPSLENGLLQPSQVMADKCSTLPLGRIGAVFGRLSDNDMIQVNRALAMFLGFV
jgi:mRNA interferase MazF